jgi:hypothetical protein
MKAYAIWKSSKVLGYCAMEETTAKLINEIDGIGVYFGDDILTREANKPGTPGQDQAQDQDEAELFTGAGRPRLSDKFIERLSRNIIWTTRFYRFWMRGGKIYSLAEKYLDPIQAEFPGHWKLLMIFDKQTLKWRAAK